MGGEDVVVHFRKIVFDVAMLHLVLFPIFYLKLWGRPYHRGFFCDDDSIRHPFLDSKMPSRYLHIMGYGLNGVTMLLTEIMNRPRVKKNFHVFGRNIPCWISNTYCTIGMFVFGLSCARLTTDVMKFSIGRLSPQFYTVCLPSINCTLPENQHVYHTDFTCTNPTYIENKKLLMAIRLSFPSGHTCYSMYTMLYFAIYLQKRMTWEGPKILKHTIQFLALLFAVYTAMVKISDYWHHWSDVLTGVLVGAIAAWITARYFSNLFQASSDSSEHNDSTTDV